MEVPACPGCRERDARIAALERRVAELEALVRDLMQRLRDRDQPPPPTRERPALLPGPAKKKTGRRPGGQPGHPPHLRQLLPVERLTKTVPFVPKHCDRCHTPLPKTASAADPEPTRHQVAEVPTIRADVTEYQGHFRTCPDCGHVSHAAIPQALRRHSIGTKLTGLLGYLVAGHGISKRGVEEIVETVFEVPVALGTIARLEQELSVALAPAHAAALAAVQAAPVKYLDETGWKQAGRKRWLWTAASLSAVAFVIDVARNATLLPRLLGQTIRGIVTSDRWSAYDHVPLGQRQICWAHLKRNWEKLVERGGQAQRLGEGCLAIKDQVFAAWHLFRGGGCTRADLDDRMFPLFLELLALLQQGRRCRDRKTARFCRRLLKVYVALWTFTHVEGVEPTNNHGERVQRRAVLWRKNCFGCHSAAGCRFVERVLTVVQTLRLQHRSTLTFLQDTIAAHRQGRPGPALVV